MIRVIGIDPGTRKIGFGILDFDEDTRRFSLIKHGLMTFNESFSYKKIKEIYNTMRDIDKEYKPNLVAIENQFLGRNVQTLLKLTHAKTAMILAFLNRKTNITIEEYSPATVKLSIAGKGNASKEELEDSINKILNLNISKDLDVSDALGVALCHLYKVHNKFFV